MGAPARRTISSERIPVTVKLENLQLLRMAADLYAQTLGVALLYTVVSYFAFHSVNLFPIELLCVGFLVLVLSRFERFRRYKPLYQQGERFHTKGRSFALEQVESLKPLRSRGWYRVYRLQVREDSGPFVFEVVDVKKRGSGPTLFERRVLDSFQQRAILAP